MTHDLNPGHPAEEDVLAKSQRCPYVTAANMQCLLAADEPHTYGHDILGDLHDDPEWGRKRSWVWYRVEQSRLVGLLYRLCSCGHIRGAHTRGPREPGGPCRYPGGCSCRAFTAYAYLRDEHDHEWRYFASTSGVSDVIEKCDGCGDFRVIPRTEGDA